MTVLRPFLCRLLLCAAALTLLHCSDETDLAAGSVHPGRMPEGSGTEQDPYRIATLDNLRWLSFDTSSWSASFVQIADIDAAPTRAWDGGKGFSPIGGETVKFTGAYNGRGHVISGLTIDRDGSGHMALFGIVAWEGRIDSVGLVDARIRGGWESAALAGANEGRIRGCSVRGSVAGSACIGGLVGRNGDYGFRVATGTVERCRFAGSVSGDEGVGGLIGVNAGSVTASDAAAEVSGMAKLGGLAGINRGVLSASQAAGSVRGTWTLIGGLVGSNERDVYWRFGEVRSCHARGMASGRAHVGGLAGDNGGRIASSYAAVDVVGLESPGAPAPSGNTLGGLIGDNWGEIEDAFAIGSVTGDSLVGGLVGVQASGSIARSYAAGRVSGRARAGGLAGEAYGRFQILSCYWDAESTGIDRAIGEAPDTLTRMGLTHTAMMFRSSFTGWDFGSTWAVDEGASYPWLDGLERPAIGGVGP